MEARLSFLLLFLLFNPCPSSAGRINVSDYSNSLANSSLSIKQYFNEIYDNNVGMLINTEDIDSAKENGEIPKMDTSIGRTFGRPFKKMMQAMIPLAFQLGMAATWAVVAALVGIKTLGVTLLILKLLLIAGAFKMTQTVYASLPMLLTTFRSLTRRPQHQPQTLPQQMPSPVHEQQFGSFFSHKGHNQGWEQPHPQNKEIHLHIHNGQLGHGTEEHIPISPWNRDGVQNPEEKHVNVMYDPYGGPQTLSTPYGHYMKIDPAQQ